MENNKHIFVFDYDGVILNSMHEKLFCGFNAYYSLNKKSCLFGGRALKFDDYPNQIKKYKETVQAYVNMIPFIGIAGENVCAFEIIEKEENCPIKKNEFSDAIDKIDKSKYRKYNNEINNLRQYYYKYSRKEIQKLCLPFSKVVNVIKSLSEKIHFEICTAKNEEDVIFWNKRFGLSNSFIGINSCDPRKNHKVSILDKIFKKNKIQKKNIFFIDDLISNLYPAAKQGFNCLLADWGYENEIIKKNISQNGIKRISQDELTAKLTYLINNQNG